MANVQCRRVCGRGIFKILSFPWLGLMSSDTIIVSQSCIVVKSLVQKMKPFSKINVLCSVRVTENIY